MNLKPHHLAMALPDMTPAEYKVLVDDIRCNGLREEIVLFEDAILDGRHRYRATVEAKIAPKFRTFAGTASEAEAFVYSRNIARRHMTVEQRQAFVLRTLIVNPKESNPKIAARTGVSKDTVRRLRGATVNEVKDENLRRVREANPHASARELARLAEVSDRTVRRRAANSADAPKAAPKPKPKKETRQERAVRQDIERALAATRDAGKSLLTARVAGLMSLLDVARSYTEKEVEVLKELKQRLNTIGELQ